MENYCVYMMSNETNSVLYIGVTNDIKRRYVEHCSGVIDGFTKKYRAHKLVYLERYSCIVDAIAREKQLKKWRREKKNMLVNQQNPSWKDLMKDEI